MSLPVLLSLNINQVLHRHNNWRQNKQNKKFKKKQTTDVFFKKNEETSRTHRRFKHLEIKTAGTFIAFSIFNSQMKTNLHTLKKLRAASCYSVHTRKHLIPSYQIWTLVVPGSDPHLISWSDSSSFSVGASQPLTIINMEENNNGGGGGGSTERRRRLVDVYEEASCLFVVDLLHVCLLMLNLWLFRRRVTKHDVRVER